MKFYFKTHYTFAVRRVGLFKKMHVPELISLAVISDTGNHFFAINVDFSGRYASQEQEKYIELLPSLIDSHWMRLRDIKKKLADYIWESYPEEPSSKLEFNHYNDEIGCVLLQSLIPESGITFRNVGQVISEHLNGMQDTDFGPGTPYRLEKLRPDTGYTFADKMEMFETHEHYPIQKEYVGYSEYAVFIKYLDQFMHRLKTGYYGKEPETLVDEYFDMHKNHDLG